jgi:hypothetical protein
MASARRAARDPACAALTAQSANGHRPVSVFTVPDLQVSRFRFFMEELRSRRCSDGQSGLPAEGDALGVPFCRSDANLRRTASRLVSRSVAWRSLRSAAIWFRRPDRACRTQVRSRQSGKTAAEPADGENMKGERGTSLKTGCNPLAFLTHGGVGNSGAHARAGNKVLAYQLLECTAVR